MSQQHPASEPEYLLPPWQGAARVMVCVGYNPVSQRLIQRASFLANAFGGDLLAVHFQLGESAAAGYQTMLQRNLDLAHGLGAQVMIEPCTALPQSIAQFIAGQPRDAYRDGQAARSRLEEVRRRLCARC